MAATTTLLGLVTPTQGTLTGTWGDTVNYGITEYLDIAIAGTLTLTGDGTVILANTTGSSSGTNITSTLSGAGTVTAQFAIVKVSGTTGVKIVQAPSFSRTYLVVNASSFAVTFKPSAASGVSIAAGETASVYYNGADYVKVVGTATAGAAGGSTTQVQYNNSGVLAGITGATSNGTALTLVAPDLGSPSSVGTMPAFTLGGTVSGGGNQINNVVIGTTTPLAGSFTTVTTTGNAGIGTTAAGSSRLAVVATSLSAATFTQTGATGYGVAIVPGADTVYDAFSINNAANTLNNIQMYGNGSARFAGLVTAQASLAVTGTLSATGTLSGGTSGTAYSFSGSAPATSLTLDASGRLGIGVSNPSVGIVVSYGTDGIIGNYYSSSGANSRISFSNTSLLNNNVSIGSSSDAMVMYTAATERARIDSAGNLGLGVTPQTWDTGIGLKAFQFSATGCVYNYSFGGNNFTAISDNFYINSSGASTYLTTNTASQYRQTAGAHQWFQAASGTQGNAISFTQAMTLDASGNLGIGTTSPTQRLDVSGGASAPIIALTTTGTAPGAAIKFLGVTSTYKNWQIGATFTTTAGALEFTPSTTDGGSTFTTPAMTLDASGRLGVGTTSPSSYGGFISVDIRGSNGGQLIVANSAATNIGELLTDGNGFNVTARTNNAMLFKTNDTERVRIDSSGIVTMNAYGAGAATFSAAGVISSVSDETWKIKDGVPVDTDAMLKKLEPGYWYYNDEKKETFGSDRQLGFYAQNVNVAIGPEAAPTPQEGKPWGYYDRSVLAITVMSLQKALATIETLTARITALETA